MGGFITAVRTLTVLPLPGRGADDPSGALYYFPIVGLIIGGLVGMLAWFIGDICHWLGGAAVAAVALTAWITGGLHLDGLGDVADAYAPGRTRERMLAIMKDSHSGAFGVIAICLALLVKTVALTQVIALASWTWLPVPFILSRTVMVMLAVTLPYARAEGGTAGGLVQSAGARHFAVAGALALILCWGCMGWSGIVFFALAFLLAFGLARWMKRAFGGVTGDLLGMANELAECVLLVGLAGAISWTRG